MSDICLLKKEKCIDFLNKDGVAKCRYTCGLGFLIGKKFKCPKEVANESFGNRKRVAKK